MPILYRTLTMDRMWALLEAHAPFTDIIVAARRVKDTSEGWLKKMVLRSVGDFPHVQIEMGDNFAGGMPIAATLAEEEHDFGTGASDYWLEERTADFKISVFYEKPGFDQQDALEMKLIEAFESAGRDLGWEPQSSVFPIKRWGPWKAKRDGKFFFPGEDTARPVTQIIMPVLYEFTGAQLKP